MGIITGIHGPIISAKDMKFAGLYDEVYVGKSEIIGEIIHLENDNAIIQIYEDNTGMTIGENVILLGHPLCVTLGPGLIGSIYDGIQRPLKNLHDKFGSFLPSGAKTDPIDKSKQWNFFPNKNIGDTITQGCVLGSVIETSSVTHKIIATQKSVGQKIIFIAQEGLYHVDDIIVKTDKNDISMCQEWPVRVTRPYKEKLAVSTPLITGLRVIDVFFPISKGGTAAIPGGFGTGKTMTQHAIAKWCDADIIIYIGCGERGNEMTDVLTEFPKLTDPRTGKSLMERTILIANTSNMPVAAREVSIYTGVTLAEYYRDMGYHVAIMADSTSRWAEALRELSGRMEEMPAEEGFPAYLPTRLAEFYERAGMVETLSDNQGSISIIGAVSPPGGDFSEPVTMHTRRFIRCFWALDRDLANARHYPAIGWIESYSEYAQEVELYWDGINPDWAKSRKKALELLKQEQKLAEIVRLIGADALPDDKRLILLVADMIKNGFLQQNSFDPIDMYCVPKKEVRILSIIMSFYERTVKIIKMGSPLSKIMNIPSREKINRARSVIPNDNLLRFDELESAMNLELDAIEFQYKGAFK